jgi:hypothetical protein
VKVFGCECPDFERLLMEDGVIETFDGADAVAVVEGSSTTKVS